MNIHELENSLPNGFHDADLRSIAIDYERKEAVLSIRVWVESELVRPGVSRPIMRAASLTLRGLEYFIIEAPTSFSTAEDRVLDVIGQVPPTDPTFPPAPSGAVGYSFYVTNWNSYIRLAASEAELNWSQ